MRTTQLFFRTFKEPPSDAEIPSHKLLEQAGYLKRISRGIFAYTPLMWRVIKKLQKIIREELDRAGAQELSLPSLHPVELWKKSGRFDAYMAEKLLYTLEDREEHDYCLAPTHEEVATTLVADWVTSYKQLPLILYQIGTKYRDEIRPRFGLMRGKEFLMKDGYSFGRSEEEMDAQYTAMREAYSNIFKRLGLDYAIVEAHAGKIGKGRSEEFQVKAEVGEDAVMVCGQNASNVEATLSVPPPFTYQSILHKQEKIPTPRMTSIEELSAGTKIVPQQILKTMLYKLIFADKEEIVAIGIRGDRSVNETKVMSYFGAIEIELASSEELKFDKGFAGPIGCPYPFHADTSAEPMTNFLSAAFEKDVHYKNTNWERDCKRPPFADFLLAQEGDTHPDHPTETFKLWRGIEVGHIFNLGTQYSEKLQANFQDEQGKNSPIWMGTFGLGVGRTAQACVEQTHDERGIIWPACIAPFQMFITAANSKDENQMRAAEELYRTLQPFEPLLDDRKERLGFKLKDADLLGLPFKIIVGKTFAEEGLFELEPRTGEKQLLTQQELHSFFERACTQSNLCIAS